MRSVSWNRIAGGLLGVAICALIAADEPGFRSIFDGTSARGWMLCDGKPLAQKFIQSEGLNPHGTGSYITVYDQKAGNFALDLDYKLSRGCNSGVFIRVSDLHDPVNSGIEVALDDTTGAGMHDSGALYDLVPARTNAQKPAGQWNHMSITAAGPRITVVLNGTEVSAMNLDEWRTPGKRRTARRTSSRTWRSANYRGVVISDCRITAATAGSRTSSSRKPLQQVPHPD